MTQPPKPDRPEQLSYATPTGRKPAGGMPFAAQIAIGFGAFVIAIVLSYGLFTLLTNAGIPSNYASMAALSIPGGLLLALILVGLIRWRWPGLLVGVVTGVGLGILIVIGLVLLLISMCFGIFKT